MTCPLELLGPNLAFLLNAYTINMVMTYDPPKRRSNKRKHRIDLAECEAAFDAPMLTREDEDGPRLISCREANPHEQEAYFREYPQI